jgi:hypothetical protein
MSDVPQTQAIRPGPGTRAVTASGSTAPTAKLAAQASAAPHRPRTERFGDAEFDARLGADRIVLQQLLVHLLGKALLGSAPDVDGDQFTPFGGEVGLELGALARQLDVFSLGLGVYGDVLAGGHRHRPGHQTGDAGDEDVAVARARHATPTSRLAVDTMPSFAPSTAARNQPMRSLRWRSAWRRGVGMGRLSVRGRAGGLTAWTKKPSIGIPAGPRCSR